MNDPAMNASTKPEYRVRTTLRGKLVLQITERKWFNVPGLGECWSTSWRDARTDDFIALICVSQKGTP